MQGLEECLPFYLYDFYRVGGLAQCQCGIFVALFVAAVDGYKVVVAAAHNLQRNLGAVVHHHRAGIQTVRSDGGEHKYIGVGSDDGASRTQ